jgi:hypothetical protein
MLLQRRTRSLVVAAAIVAASLVPGMTEAGQRESPAHAPCRPSEALVSLPDLPEASGVAVSRRTPGRVWVHNDSGEPTLFALDSRGAVTARVRVAGATVEDWEALAVGACDDGSCLYVADIGDNAAERDHITIYRIPEPAGGEQAAVVAEVIHATYPDGAHDAETLLVTQDGTILLVTKGETGPIGVYRVPRDARSRSMVRLERIGEAIQGKAAPDDRVTDGAISPDGQWTVLRSRAALVFYRTTDFVKGVWRDVRRVDLTPLREAQGEGVALGSDAVVYVVGEGGGKQRPGTFTRFTCEPQS